MLSPSRKASEKSQEYFLRPGGWPFCESEVHCPVDSICSLREELWLSPKQTGHCGHDQGFAMRLMRPEESTGHLLDKSTSTAWSRRWFSLDLVLKLRHVR